MINTSFKQTEIGEIPRDWNIAQISEICVNLDNMRKPITKSKRTKGNVPYYGAMGVQDYVSGYIFDEDLVLVAEDCGNYKHFGQTAYTIRGKAWVNNHAHILRCKNVDWIFLKEYLNYQDVSHFINTGNRDKLNKAVLERIPVSLPSSGEQKKITAVLTTVDCAIEETDEIIEHSKRLKKGLMQELLTRGIGHKKFKETGIGELPEEWAFAKLSDKCSIIKGKKPQNVFDEQVAGSRPYLLIEHMTGNGKSYTDDKRVPDCSKEDTLLIMDGSRSGLVFTGYSGAIGSTFGAIHPKDETVTSNFVFYFLQTKYDLLQTHRTKGAIPHVDKQILRDIILPLPPLAEQKKIAAILTAADAKIESEIQKRAKLETLKKGLMQDLLTGRVRFPEFVKRSNHAN
jgi:type I restriction enzyme S subunit